MAGKKPTKEETQHRQTKFMAQYDVAEIREADDAALQALVLKLAPGLVEWNRSTPRQPHESEDYVEMLAKIPVNPKEADDLERGYRVRPGSASQAPDKAVSKEEAERRRQEFLRKQEREAYLREEEVKRKREEELRWAVGTMRLDPKEEAAIATTGVGGRQKTPEQPRQQPPTTYNANLDKELDKGIKKVRKMTVEDAKKSGL